MMQKTQYTTLKKKVSRLTKQVARLEKVAATALKRARGANQRVRAVLSNQQHYLRFRAPVVNKRQEHLMAGARAIAKRLQGLPQFKLTSTVGVGRKTQRHLLMVDGNQAKKLTNLLKLDFRSIINALPHRVKKVK